MNAHTLDSLSVITGRSLLIGFNVEVCVGVCFKTCPQTLAPQPPAPSEPNLRFRR